MKFRDYLLDIPKLDLRFVAYGVEEDSVFSIRGPFGNLNQQERYLLYVYYGLDKSIRETADIMEKNKITIWTDLHYVHKKLSDQYVIAEMYSVA